MIQKKKLRSSSQACFQDVLHHNYHRIVQVPTVWHLFGDDKSISVDGEMLPLRRCWKMLSIVFVFVRGLLGNYLFHQN